MGADAIRLVLIFCHYTCGLSWPIARYVCEVGRIPSSLHRFLSRFWASTLPKWGKHVTQQGQARCPTWAHFLLLPCPISHFFITPISSYFFPFPWQRNLPNLPSLPITFHPIIPHPLPSSSAVIKLYEILQTASGQLPDTFPSNTPGPASRQWVDNPKSLSMLISKCFDHYFQFMLRFYIQG